MQRTLTERVTDHIEHELRIIYPDVKFKVSAERKLDGAISATVLWNELPYPMHVQNNLRGIINTLDDDLRERVNNFGCVAGITASKANQSDKISNTTIV